MGRVLVTAPAKRTDRLTPDEAFWMQKRAIAQACWEAITVPQSMWRVTSTSGLRGALDKHSQSPAEMRRPLLLRGKKAAVLLEENGVGILGISPQQ